MDINELPNDYYLILHRMREVKSSTIQELVYWTDLPVAKIKDALETMKRSRMVQVGDGSDWSVTDLVGMREEYDDEE